MAVTSALVDNATRTGSSGSTSTISSASFGTAATGRVLVVPCFTLSGASINSATIGGVSATVTGTAVAGYILSAVVASGTSGNIVANLSGSDQVVSNGVVALTGANNATPSDSIVDDTTGAGNIDVGAGGSLLAFSVSFTVSGSWTGATDVRTDTSLGVPISTATFDNSGGALTNRAVSYSTGVRIVAAAFDASGGGGSTYTLTADQGSFALSGQAANLVITPNWSFVGVTEAAVNAATTSYAVTEPSGTAQNDVLVCDIATRGTNVWSTPAGWTLAQSDAGGNTTNNTTASDVSIQTFYCIRGASAPTLTFTRTGTVTSMRALATVRAYRSNKTGSPTLDTSAILAMGAAGTALTLSGGVTTTALGDLIVTAVFGSRANTVSNMDGVTEVTGNSGATDTTTQPVRGTWTERSDRNNGTSPTVALACYDTIKVTAGSTGNLTATESQSALHGMTALAFKHPAANAYTLTAAQGSFALAGQAAALRNARKLISAQGTFTLSGQAAALRRGYTLSANQGSFALTGQAAGLKRTYALIAASGSFALSGQSATLRFGHVLTANQGSFALTGQAATLRFGHVLTAGQGSFSLAGQAANLVYTPASAAYVLTAAVGTFSLTGQQATLRKASKLIAAQGSLALNGQTATLRLARKLVASAGSLSLAGQVASLRFGHKLVAGTGQITLTGFDAQLIKGAAPGAYVLTAATGTLSLTGYDANLVYGRAGERPGGGEVVFYGKGRYEKTRGATKRKIRLKETLQEAINRAIEELERKPNPVAPKAIEAVQSVRPVIDEIPAGDAGNKVLQAVNAVANVGKSAPEMRSKVRKLEEAVRQLQLIAEMQAMEDEESAIYLLLVA